MFLGGHETVQLMLACDVGGLFEQLWRHVRGGCVTHLALPDQVLQCPQRLLEWHRRIGSVQIEHVEIVSIQPPEAAFGCLQHIASRSPPDRPLLAMPNLLAITTCARRAPSAFPSTCSESP